MYRPIQTDLSCSLSYMICTKPFFDLRVLICHSNHKHHPTTHQLSLKPCISVIAQTSPPKAKKARLVSNSDGLAPIEISQRCRIGRGKEADVMLEDPHALLSRVHAEIYEEVSADNLR